MVVPILHGDVLLPVAGLQRNHASPIFGYALGQQAADWLEGKSVPQAMDILPKALTLGNIAQYEADVADTYIDDSM